MSGKKDAESRTPSLACGFHAVESALRRRPESLQEVHIDGHRRDVRIRKLRGALEKAGIRLIVSGRDELDRLAGGLRHQGVVARVTPRTEQDDEDLAGWIDGLPSPRLLLVLDRVQDPHNLGACLRTADGAGVQGVILPRDGACPVNDTVVRVAAGATDNVRVFYVPNLVRAMEAIRAGGFWVTGAADEADLPLYDSDLIGDVAIVMGAEGKGLRRLTREHCDTLVSIPMLGTVSSLNVSVATGLMLYEVVRQRRLSAGGQPAG